MLTVTTGEGNTRPRGRRTDAVSIADLLTQLPPQVESWWSTSVYRGDHRNIANWESAAGVGIDVDFYAEGIHAAAPPEAHTEAEDSFRAGGLPGTLFHTTPRGLRVVFLFVAQLTDRAVFLQAIEGARQRVDRALRDSGFAAAGFAVDEGALDLARMLYTPNAIVHGESREADVLGDGPTYEPAILALGIPGQSEPQEPERRPTNDPTHVGTHRNNHLASLAGSMRQRGMCEEAISAALLAENRARCTPPLGEEEVRRVSRSIAKYAPAETRAPSEIDPNQAFATAHELSQRGLGTVRWVIPSLFVRGGVTYIYGDPKAGKTTFLMALLIEAAMGRPPFGTFELPDDRALRVLVFSEQPDALNVQLEAVFNPGARDRTSDSRGWIRYMVRSISGLLGTLRDVVALAERAARELGADLVVFDTALDWMRGLDGKSINDAEAMAEAGRMFREIATECDCAVGLIHHARKAGGDLGADMLGSLAIRASSDVNVQVKRGSGSPTQVIVRTELRDPSRLVELAAGRASGRNPAWAFELQFESSMKGMTLSEWVRFKRVDLPKASPGDATDVGHADVQAVDDKLAHLALRSLTQKAWNTEEWIATEPLPAFSKDRIAAEMGALVNSDAFSPPDKWASPGDNRLRKMRERLINEGLWADPGGNRGTRLAEWSPPRKTPDNEGQLFPNPPTSIEAEQSHV